MQSRCPVVVDLTFYFNRPPSSSYDSSSMYPLYRQNASGLAHLQHSGAVCLSLSPIDRLRYPALPRTTHGKRRFCWIISKTFFLSYHRVWPFVIYFVFAHTILYYWLDWSQWSFSIFWFQDCLFRCSDHEFQIGIIPVISRFITVFQL